MRESIIHTTVDCVVGGEYLETPEDLLCPLSPISPDVAVVLENLMPVVATAAVVVLVVELLLVVV